MSASITPQHPSLYRIVVAHYILSAINFVLLAVLLWFAKSELLGHYFHPQLLAITHLAALGWASLIIFGACYQLLPVILETELYSYKLAWISLGLFIIGLALFICSLWNFDLGWCIQIGSVLLLIAILLFGVNTFITAKRIKKPDVYQDFIITSCIWLIATATLGVLLVFNLRFGFLPKDHMHFLKLHAHMGIVGWFLLLIIGVSSKLLPMFLVTSNSKTKFLSWTYNLLNLALLLFLIDTYVFGLNYKTYFIVTIALVATTFWGVYIYQCFKSRMRKSIDLPIIYTLISISLLALAVLSLPFIIYYQLKSDLLAVRFTTIYGSLIFMGWISAIILGQTFKTLPFIVWTKKYEDIAGKTNIPLPADLFNNYLLKIQLISFTVFVVSYFYGLFLSDNLFINIGLASFLIAAICYLSNVLIVVFYKRKIN
jgi:hypothetical protein